MENEIISKELEAALKSFEAKNNQVPEGYFDSFELELMQKIKATSANTPKATIISILNQQKKYLVAASLILVVATGYLLYDNDKNKINYQGDLVQIEALPDEVIEAYLNENEVMAEVDWNDAIEAIGVEINLNN
jgi:hypothetical protein